MNEPVELQQNDSRNDLNDRGGVDGQMLNVFIILIIMNKLFFGYYCNKKSKTQKSTSVFVGSSGFLEKLPN